MIGIVIILVIFLIVFNVYMRSTGPLKDEYEDKKAFKEELRNFNSDIDKMQHIQQEDFIEQKEILINEAETLINAKTFINSHNFLKAIETCNKFLSVYPYNRTILTVKADAKSLYGRISKIKNELYESLEIVEYLLNSNRNDRDLLLLMGDTYLGLINTDETFANNENEKFRIAEMAAEAYLKAYELDNTDMTTLAEFSLAKLYSGNIYTAAYYIKKAKEISPDNKRVTEIYELLMT